MSSGIGCDGYKYDHDDDVDYLDGYVDVDVDVDRYLDERTRDLDLDLDLMVEMRQEIVDHDSCCLLSCIGIAYWYGYGYGSIGTKSDYRIDHVLNLVSRSLSLSLIQSLTVESRSTMY